MRRGERRAPSAALPADRSSPHVDEALPPLLPALRRPCRRHPAARYPCAAARGRWLGCRDHRRLDPHRSGRRAVPAGQRNRDGAGREVGACADSRRGAGGRLVGCAGRLRADRSRALRHVGDLSDWRQRLRARHVRPTAQSGRDRSHDAAASGRAALGRSHPGMRRSRRRRATRAIVAKCYIRGACARCLAIAAAHRRSAETAQRVAADRQADAPARPALEGRRQRNLRHRCAPAGNGVRAIAQSPVLGGTLESAR